MMSDDECTVVVRGLWFVVRGSWVVGRGSWVVGRGSWWWGGDIENMYALPPDPFLKKETMTGVIW